jgi:hypothetical protein
MSDSSESLMYRENGRQRMARRALFASIALVAIAVPAAAAGPDTSDTCRSGSIACVDRVLAKMERRAAPAIDSCDHDAIFDVMYLRMTEEVRTSLVDPDYFAPDETFSDVPFLAREDAVFAEFYFWADRRFHDGRRVPRAWRTAFRAAEDQAVSGLGNALLGANAHIKRDLPIVLFRLGLGSKTDHDKVDDVLERVADDVLDELARRFDQSLQLGNPVPGSTLDNEAFLLTSITAWRAEAWTDAERLRDAANRAERRAVKRDIEDAAEANAQTLQSQLAYPSGLAGEILRDARNSYCAAHHFDP